MRNTITAALFFLAAGIFTSVTILGAYQILFAVPIIYFTYLAIKNNEFEVPKSAWWLLAFTAVAFISILVNIELTPRPSRNFGKLKYMLYGVGGIFALRFWLKEATDKTKKMLVNVFLLSIVVAGLYACWEIFIAGKPRVKGLTDTMRYGYGSGMVLLTLLSGILQHDKTKKWLDIRFGIIAFIIGFIGMYLTYTRGGLLGFLCGLPFVLYFYKPKLGISLGAIALMIVLALGGFYLFGSGNYESRFLANKNVNSDVIRRSMWKAALISIQEKPIIGWGHSNFHTQVNRIKIENDLDAKFYNDAHSHNIFLEIASGTGIIGLFLFLGWLASWAIECFKRGGIVRAMIVPFGVAFVISGQFEVTLDANNASMIFFLYAISSVRGSRAV